MANYNREDWEKAEWLIAKERRQLIEAVRYYANPHNWFEGAPGHGIVAAGRDVADWTPDEGKVAREALAAVGVVMCEGCGGIAPDHDKACKRGGRR